MARFTLFTHSGKGGGGRIVAGTVSSGDEEFEVHRCMLSNS